eukprot:6303551-Amphidinium_carterae.1
MRVHELSTQAQTPVPGKSRAEDGARNPGASQQLDGKPSNPEHGYVGAPGRVGHCINFVSSPRQDSLGARFVNLFRWAADDVALEGQKKACHLVQWGLELGSG